MIGKNVSALKLRAVNAPPNIDLLWGLKPQKIDLILAAARPRRFAAKTVMTHQRDPSDHLYLLWKGRARYFYTGPDGKKFIMIWITPGHAFAGAALAPRPYPYLSTEAVCDSVVLVWDSPTIRALEQRFPRLFENIVPIALDYISWYISAYTALTSDTAEQRLANLPVGLAPSIGRTVSSRIELDATNEELASSANISPLQDEPNH
jgi:CRP-like cAMP-binding protein